MLDIKYDLDILTLLQPIRSVFPSSSASRVKGPTGLVLSNAFAEGAILA